MSERMSIQLFIQVAKVPRHYSASSNGVIGDFADWPPSSIANMIGCPKCRFGWRGCTACRSAAGVEVVTHVGCKLPEDVTCDSAHARYTVHTHAH